MTTNKPNDGTFTSSGGGSAAGVVLDLSVVTQSDGVTQVKRERIVPGGDDGSLQTFSNDGAVVAGQVNDRSAVDLLQQLVIESRRQTKLLILIAHEYNIDVDLVDLDDFDTT